MMKVFTAKSMPEALALVKREFGADGVILHTRTYRRGGVMGLGAQSVVEVTAARGRDIGRQRRRAAPPRRTTAASPIAPSRELAPVPEKAGDLIKRTYAAARAELSAASSAAPPAPPPPATIEHEQLAAEMRAVKRMVGRMMRTQESRADGKPADMPDTLFDQYLALLEQEVAEELADEVIANVREKLSADDADNEVACRQAVRECVADLLPQGEQTLQPQRSEDNRPRTIALVGPTGVGKTTTIAKLAATYKLKQDLRVGLITMDTYRIAAVDQLRTYAGIIGVPLQVALSPNDLKTSLHACADCDVVLLDTAGRSPRNDRKLEELSTFLRSAQPHEVHLVLSSTCTQSVLMDAVERFSKIRTERIIFTKLDEAVTFGVLLNVARKVNKRLSYLTTGQEVPHQIEPGRPERLAELVVGEGQVTS